MDPTVCIRRSQNWVFGPEEDYEISGDVSNVVFPTGYVIEDDQDTLYLYYGAADSSICLAVAKISELLAWLEYDGCGCEVL